MSAPLPYRFFFQCPVRCLIAMSVLSVSLQWSVAQIDTEPLHWPDKNGPSHDGRTHGEFRLALESAQNIEVVWRVSLQYEGHSTPVIGGDFIWITEATKDGKKQWLRAFDTRNGNSIHELLLFENPDPEPLGNPLNNYAAPSCVLDKERVYAHFGSYGTACVDVKTGIVKWQRRDLPARHYRGPGSSPVLHEGRLILTFDGVDQQYVVCLDAMTGATLWLTKRSTEYGDLDENGVPTREGDLRKAYHTPLVIQQNATWMVISVGARAAFGYDLLTGSELWQMPHAGYNAAVRPIVTEDLLIINTGSERAETLALPRNLTWQGMLDESVLAWKQSKRNASEANAIVANQELFQITRGGILTCLNLQNGTVIGEGRLPGQFLGSPILHHQILYFCNDRGQCFGVRADRSLEIVVQHEFDEPISAGLAVLGEDVIVRGRQSLFRLSARN